MVLVMDTLTSGGAAVFGRFQIMAMAMEQLQVPIPITSALTTGDDVIDFHEASLGEVPSAARAPPVLRFEQGGNPAVEPRMVLQPFHPVEQIAIIRASRALYLHVTLDGDRRVLFEHVSLLGLERPAFALVQCPVFVADPSGCLVWVSAPCPAPQHAVEPMVALTKHSLCHHRTVVVGPTGDDGV